ncbi:MAG: FeoB-associated Cys-rich membrane protein [Clostridiales bacterium]|nr:FeoB-associated Cys-rich membrane protein [Clostridiales bacterium]
MTFGTIIVGAIVLAALVGAIASIIKSKKNNKGCSGSCCGCSSQGNCY